MFNYFFIWQRFFCKDIVDQSRGKDRVINKYVLKKLYLQNPQTFIPEHLWRSTLQKTCTGNLTRISQGVRIPGFPVRSVIFMHIPPWILLRVVPGIATKLNLLKTLPGFSQQIPQFSSIPQIFFRILSKISSTNYWCGSSKQFSSTFFLSEIIMDSLK